jgi:aspartyl-tRNA(Asn)/glutamyl-tRNA(Gln) amidotransferase subunit A
MFFPHTITAQAEAIRSGQFTVRELIDHTLTQIRRGQPQLNAFTYIAEEAALQRAAAIDRTRQAGEPLGPLAGVPIAVKDNICTADMPTTCGSENLRDFQSLEDATAVERLRAAGAIIIGKTNLDEFGMGSSTEHSVYGPVRNPWDTQRVAGGSSGGSAAAVAARLAPGALGSDTGGSLRLPASFCGVVACKPTYGRVSRYGLVAFASSLEQIGPICTTVEDAALLLSVISGADPRDSTCRPLPPVTNPAVLAQSSTEGLSASVSGLRAAPPPESLTTDDAQPLAKVRVGVPREFFDEGLDPEVNRAVRAALDDLAAAGAVLIELELPRLAHATACYYVLACAEASSNLARYDGIHYGKRAAGAPNIERLYARTRSETLGSEVQRRIMLGTYVLSAGYYDQYYQKASQVRQLLQADLARAFERVDLIAGPTAPTTAFLLGARTDDPLTMYLTDVYTTTANLAGNGAISVPCGLDSAGLPIGLQLMAPPLQEDTLLSVAHWYQLITDHHTKLPPLHPKHVQRSGDT